MNYWRMAFRAGSNGYEMWPACLKYGVAAISYEPLDRYDLSKHTKASLSSEWSELNSSQSASLRRVAYEMRKGDVIYVKQGPHIVGRGRVLGSYRYNLRKQVVDDHGNAWPHQVPVAWEKDFPEARVLVGGELITVLKLSPEKLKMIEGKRNSELESERRQFSYEGELSRSYVTFKKRNRALIEAYKARHSSDYRCEVCSFSFSSVYRKISDNCLEVHHRKPLSEMKARSKTTIDDLVLLCPNCHTAIHTKKPPLSVEDLKKLKR